jgi:uncharacterized membrane protein YeaQ/YmgE (transglycosylase-associated protein family)
MPSLAEFTVCIVMGLVGGSLAGLVITQEGKGFGLVQNMRLGLAIVGGLLFRLLGLLPGLDAISISLRDVVAAFVGSRLFSQQFCCGGVCLYLNNPVSSRACRSLDKFRVTSTRIGCRARLRLSR